MRLPAQRNPASVSIARLDAQHTIRMKISDDAELARLYWPLARFQNISVQAFSYSLLITHVDLKVMSIVLWLSLVVLCDLFCTIVGDPGRRAGYR